MKIIKKSILLICFLFGTLSSFAQNDVINITGTVTEPKNTEITVWVKIAGVQRNVASYLTTPDSKDFSLAIPYRTDASYQLKITVMKMGKMRLESSSSVTFPLELTAKQNINITLTPSKFDEKKFKGIEIEKKAPKFSTASINGKLINWKFGGELSIERVVEGRFEKVGNFNIDRENSTFNFLVPIENESFYYLSSPRWKKRLYLKPNDYLILNVDGPTGVETEWEKTTAENKVLFGWEQLIVPATGYGYNLEQRSKAIVDPVAFRLVYEGIQSKIKGYLKHVNTPNSKFNTVFKTVAQLDNSLIALRSLLYTSGKKHLFWLPAKEFSNVDAFYKEVVNQNRINSADLLLLGEGNEYLNLYAKFSLNELEEQKIKQLDDAEKLALMMNAVPNEILKSFLLKSQLDELNVNNYSEFKNVFVPYEKYTKPSSVKWKYNHVLSQFAPDTVFIGKSAYDFTLPDTKGKMVNMKDFKGKVVLIDVWATWCGPCKAQFPFLKEVEESYHGNDDIVFVGISLDNEKDKQKWLTMIKDKELAGIQLLDNVGKSFARKYLINAIPRFLLIDKQGNWVEVRCPLPENKDRLKAYIDRELKK
jgi:thiol-disulfide isomerase/thioredoxin